MSSTPIITSMLVIPVITGQIRGIPRYNYRMDAIAKVVHRICLKNKPGLLEPGTSKNLVRKQSFKRILKYLRAVNTSFVCKASHPGRKRNIFADGSGIDLGTVFDSVNADYGKDSARIS